MDVDIDLRSDTPIRKIFPNWVPAMQVVNNRAMKHACGIHPQGIPVDPLSGIAAIPYKEAATAGYFKIDMLHNTIYSHFESKMEIDALLEIEPPWELLKSPGIVRQLFQLSKHWDLVKTIQPKTVEDLADAIALIRPGKQNLVKLYARDKEQARELLYSLNDETYSFKKSHSIAYALVIVLQLHLINAGVDFT